MAILILKPNEPLNRTTETEFESEDFMQQYIKKYPEQILTDIKPKIKLLTFREFPTKITGGIDILAIDADGDIYLIETKLSRNSDRRDVVAQILDYASALSFEYTNNEFIDTLRNEVSQQIDDSIKYEFKELFNNSKELEDSQLVSRIIQNRKNDNFKFIVAMDKVDDKLRHNIEFINRNSRMTILALELEYYRYDGQEIMVTRWFGAGIKKNSSMTSDSVIKYAGTQKGFFEQVDKNIVAGEISTENAAVIRRLYDFVNECQNVGVATVLWGNGKKGSFILIVPRWSTSRMVFKMDTFGMIQIAIANLPSDYGSYFLSELRKVRRLERFLHEEQGNYYIKIEDFAPAIDDFISILNKMIKGT